MLPTHLIKIRLQKVHFRLILQQTRPVLLIQLLLLQDQLDGARGVVNLGS